MRHGTRNGVVGLLLLASVGMTAGTASASTSPAQYAKAYCKNVQTFRLDLAKQEGAFHAVSSADTTDLVAGRRQIVAFLRAQAKAAGKAAQAIGDVDPPDVKKGEQLANGVTDALQGFQDQLGVLADNAQRLSTTDATAFAKAATRLDGGGFVKSLRRLDRKLTALSVNRPLGKALAAEKACPALF